MKISVQIYSLREAGDLDTQLALARSCGFTWVETVATHDLSPQAFADKVAAHELQVSSMHAALALLEADMASVIEACRLTRCPLVVMPWLPMGERPPTAAGFRALGQRLAALGDALRPHGVQLAYHNHDFEFLQYEGRTALEWIFSAVTPAQLGWEADLGWVSRAGADPQMWLDKFADRLAAVHAKDMAAPRMALEEDGWTTLGQGIVPWAALLAQLKTRTDLVVFEHDHPVDFESTLRNSHAFLTQYLTTT